MKNYLTKFACLLLCSGFLFSCSDDDDINYKPDMNGAYIFNFGNWGAGGSSISQFDYNNSVMTNDFYELVNGIELTGNIEYAYNYNDQTFLLENNPDQIITLNDTLAQLKNGVPLENPRACVGNGNYLYISCWGDTPDWNLMPDSYIAKYNINTMTVEDTIFIAGGPEGVEMANGKLYVAMNFKKNVAVINLDDNSISYIETPAVCSYFVKDDDNNLYVSFVGTSLDPSYKTGLGYIDTVNDKLTNYSLANVSSSYSQIMTMNNDKSKIYVIAAPWVKDANGKWSMVGGIFVFNTETKAFEADPVISNILGADAITVNPENDDLYITTSPSFTDPGVLNVYGSDGIFKKTYTTGISPNHIIFL